MKELPFQETSLVKTISVSIKRLFLHFIFFFGSSLFVTTEQIYNTRKQALTNVLLLSKHNGSGNKGESQS